MDNLIDGYYKSNCYNLSSIGNGSIVDWLPDRNVSRIIDVQPNPFFTNLRFKRFNATHYQWCGPMLMIVEYFARITNVKYDHNCLDF